MSFILSLLFVSGAYRGQHFQDLWPFDLQRMCPWEILFGPDGKAAYLLMRGELLIRLLDHSPGLAGIIHQEDGVYWP